MCVERKIRTNRFHSTHHNSAGSRFYCTRDISTCSMFLLQIFDVWSQYLSEEYTYLCYYVKLSSHFIDSEVDISQCWSIFHRNSGSSYYCNTHCLFLKIKDVNVTHILRIEPAKCVHQKAYYRALLVIHLFKTFNC